MHRRIAIASLGFLVLAYAVAAKAPENPRHIALPNPRLLGCGAPTCQLWLEENLPADAIYPLRMNLDIFDGFDPPKLRGADQNGAPYGLITWYDKSVLPEEVEAAINSVYGRSMVRDTEDTPVKLWRVESEKFVIQLVKCGKHFDGCDEGNIQLIYLAFVPKAPNSPAEPATSRSRSVSLRFVALPNPKLIGCLFPACQLWLDPNPPADALYPTQIKIDISEGSHFAIPNGSPYAFTTLWNGKAIRITALQASINSAYGSFVCADSGNWPIKLWRNDPEKFVIQLSTCGKHESWCTKGDLSLIYIPIGHPNARYYPPR